MELSGGTLCIEMHDIVASDMAVYVLCTVSASRSGQPAGFLEVHVWRIFDGRAVEFREFQVTKLLRTNFKPNPSRVTRP